MYFEVDRYELIQNRRKPRYSIDKIMKILCITLMLLLFLNLSLSTVTKKNLPLSDQPDDEKKENNLQGRAYSDEITSNINTKKQRDATIYKYLQKSISNAMKPEKYWNISSVPEYKELPFCIASFAANPKPVLKSIETQKYSNFKFVYFGGNQQLSKDKAVLVESTERELMANDQAVLEKCGLDSVIIITDSALKDNSLFKLNKIYQENAIWLTYSIDSDVDIGVSSFFGYMLRNLRKNQRYGPDFQALSKNQNFVILALLQLARIHCFPISNQNLFQSKQKTLYTDHQSIFEKVGRHKILQTMYTLSQDYAVDQARIKKYWNQLLQNQKFRYKQRLGISQEQMLQAIQNKQLKSLPANHSLFERDRIYYQTKYSLTKYEKELPLCIVIPSNNNIQNHRYMKVFQTIFYQQYSNYHIVFIDDVSTDQTLNETKRYVKERNFDQSRIDYIRTQVKRYATYNLRNAAHNYCHSKQVFVIVDGDDQLVGRYVFSMLNMKYQSRDNWMVYSNFFSSDYFYGGSKPLPDDFFQQKRVRLYVFGPIRTFYVDLYRKIDDKDHQYKSGKFLDTGYDFAMQYPLLEMARAQHTEYVTELCYFYNSLYGNNDDSTGQGGARRKRVTDQILQRRPYKQLDRLFEEN